MTASQDGTLEHLLARVVLHRELHGALPPLDAIAAEHPHLAAELRAAVERYAALSASLDTGVFDPDRPAPASAAPPAGPSIEGFRTVERLGGGGMGEVYKLHDLKLDRFVAAKFIRRDARHRAASMSAFLREARSMALFSDPRIVRIYECRFDADPAVILMEHVDGFELGHLGPSLEYSQRARVMRDVCDAVHHAHRLGLTHRDLKPANIMLDGALAPKILDFGLSDGDPTRGHLQGTVHYIAPEQLDPSRPIDARTDVYALGVILYELLCGTTPWHGTTEDVLEGVRSGQPRLPREIRTDVPEPLQLIALKAMEKQPADRYASAHEMALDLGRYLAGQPVIARSTVLATTLQARVKPHLDQIAEWVRLRLIYPHEAERLAGAYRTLDSQEEDWIVASRSLSYSQIALYLGAFFLFAGGLFYFYAHRVLETAQGLTRPALVLGVPLAGLTAASLRLYRRGQRGAAVAFALAGLSLLPLFLLIVFHESGLWVASADDPRQLFPGAVSNRQLQVTVGLTCLWAGWLSLRTRTSALSTVASLLIFLFAVALAGDLGLRTWLEEGRFDLPALCVAPMVAIYAALGVWQEQMGRSWLARPLFVAGALTLVLTLDLLALDGRLFHYVGLTLRTLGPSQADDPELLDTLAALALNGGVFYLAGAALERRGTPGMRLASRLLLTIAPFSMLEPLAWLSNTGIYHQRFDWMYLLLAIAIAVLSQRRQRKSFYYAGVLNSGAALLLIARRNEWLDKVGWAAGIVAIGVAVLVIGLMLDARERRRTG